MIVVGWLVLAVVAAFVMMAASRAAIRHAVRVADALSVSPFVIGVALVSIGTDIPEIVSSIVAAYLGHGDIIVGDSIGSVFTQGTLGLGLLPIFAGRAISIARGIAGVLPAATLVGLAMGAWLVGDGELTRAEAIALLFAGGALISLVTAYAISDPALDRRTDGDGRIVRSAVLAFVALGVVGVAASGLVQAIVALSKLSGVPEYVLSFFGAALGTSLPEIAVELTAILRRQHLVALGDVLGSCLVDATLSIAAGPALFPTTVSVELALRGFAIAAVTTVVSGVVLAGRGGIDRTMGLFLIAAYIAGFAAFFAVPMR